MITKNIFQGTIVLNPEYSKSKSLKTKKENPYQSKDITFYHNITYLNGSNEREYMKAYHDPSNKKKKPLICY